MIVGLVVVGFAAHSRGLLAAGGDYVADCAAIALELLAVAIRTRNRGSKAPTYVAAVNASALLLVSAFVLIAGIRRLVNGTPEVHGLPVLIVSSIATVVMLVGVFVLGPGAGGEDLHMRSVLLDTISDAVASAAVAIGGAVIYLTGRFYWIDSALSVVIAVVIGTGARPPVAGRRPLPAHGQPARPRRRLSGLIRGDWDDLPSCRAPSRLRSDARFP